jgi:proline racemase
MAHVKTIDAHVGGTALRLLVDGFPAARGESLAAKAAWAARRVDVLRRALMLEPRGHQDMRGAVLTEPVSPHAQAGVLLMDADRFGGFSVTSTLAAAAIAIDRRLLVADGPTIVDTPAGPLTVTCTSGSHGELHLCAAEIPATVLFGGLEFAMSARRLRADIVDVGGPIAIVDGESSGVALDVKTAPEMRRTARAIAAAVDHLLAGAASSIDSVVFTAPAQQESAAMRVTRVTARGALGRSASGAGAAGVLAVLDAMGLIDGESLAFEGLSGEITPARLTRRTVVGERASIVASVDATVWITGEHTFVVSEHDRLSEGFLAEMG